MNDDFECFIKKKITSLLRIRENIFTACMQHGTNKDELNNFFLASPVNTVLFFVLYKYTYDVEAGDQAVLENSIAQSAEETNSNIEKEEINKSPENKKDIDSQIHSHNSTDETIKKQNDESKKTEKTNEKENISNEKLRNNTNQNDNKEEITPELANNNCEEEENADETKKTKCNHYILKMSINNINIDDHEEENLQSPSIQPMTDKKNITTSKHIVYFLKIKNDKIQDNLDEYFNNNYTFGNLHHNYINNFKTYFKIFFIPFFLSLVKKNDAFEYLGKEIEHNEKMDNILIKIQNFKKNEMFYNKLYNLNELNENKYLNIIEKEKQENSHYELEWQSTYSDIIINPPTLDTNNFMHQQKDFSNIDDKTIIVNKDCENKNIDEINGKNELIPNTYDIINNLPEHIDELNYGENENDITVEKKEKFIRNKNILSALYYLISYYKQILKVEQMSYNEINTDIIKLKDDGINIDSYLRTIYNLIKNFMLKEQKNYYKKTNDKTHPAYWKERYHRIYNFLEKINSKKFEKIIENIKGKVYNNELSNEIKSLLKEIESIHIESFEMIKFSKLLENSFETLRHSNINKMKNGIKLVIRKIKNIWLSSNYFRKEEIIIAFFLKLSEIIFEFIHFLAIKVKKINNPKSIKKNMSKCIDILKFYEKEFIYAKLDIEIIDIRKNWYFDKNLIFKNIRHLQHVLATLHTVYSEIIYFTDLCLLKLKKLVNNKKIMNSIMVEVNKLYEPFNGVLKNIYQYDDESIMQLMKNLNEQCLNIEKKCIKIISMQFSNLRDTKSTYLLVEKFQNLKKNYKIDRLLIKKLYDILFLYKRELYLYINLFNNMCNNKDLDIYKRLLFCLSIYKKIKKPILIFKTNNYITTSNEYKIIVKLYINFCKKMFSYIVEKYVQWKNNSLSQMNKFLSSNIITINKQLNFFYVINFDNNFFKTLYEYAYIESIYDFNAPIEILNMYKLKKNLYKYLYELDEIILFYKKFTENTSIIQQKVLIKYFQEFEQKLIYISNNINWLNLNIYHYINDLNNCKNTIQNVHLSLSYSLNSIDKIIFNMQNINVVKYIEWENMNPLNIQPFFNYFEQYRIDEIKKAVEKYKEISQILIKIEQIIEKTKNGRSEVMDELYYLYQCKIYKCLSLIIIKGLCTYETLIENDFPKKVLHNYKPCLYIKEDIHSDVFLNNSIQNIFKLISKLLTNLLLSSSEFIRWLDYSCIEVPISLKEDFEFFKTKFSFYQSVSKNKIIIDRIIHIHQLIQNVFQKANKYIYSFLKYDNIINSIVKTQNNFSMHQNITYPLIYYDNILKYITNIQNKIDKENDKKTIQFISLNISFVLNAIKNKLFDSKKFFFNNLHYIFTTLKCSTLSEITNGILKTSSNSMDKYENIIKTINKIKAENINIEINIQKTEEIYNMLTIYEDINIKDEEKNKLLLLYPLYLNMLNLAFFNDNLMFTVKKEFYEKTKKRIILFEEKIKSILEKFHSVGPSSENIDLNEGMESLKKYISDFKSLEIEKEEIIKDQILCNMKILLFEKFYLLKNTIKIYNSIYSIYNYYVTRINDFLDIIYYKLNVKDVYKSLKEVKSELLKLQKEQPGAENIEAFKKINEELRKMNITLIIVYLLQNTNMKIANWNEILNLHLKKNNTKDPTAYERSIIINYKNDNIKSITLYDLHELKIYLYFNDIKYIIYKIKEVEKLEKCLNQIENRWKHESLKLVKFNDYLILDNNNNKNIFKNIKKTFEELHLMRGLNFASDLIPKINNLENKLLFIYELLVLWMLIQEAWIKLERFYNKENFNNLNSFNDEFKNFDQINKTYYEIMKNTKKNLDLYRNCNTKFFYFLKNYYDRLLFLSNKAITILQEKKFNFPDFFFLTEDQLFDLLSNTQIQNLKKYCFIIYEEMSSFNDVDKIIIEIVTTKGNVLVLKNGVKITGIGTYAILKDKIKITLKENIITNLNNYYTTNKIIPIIKNSISVVSNIIIKILLSEEIKNIIQKKSIEYTNQVLNKFIELCNDIIKELKCEKDTNIMKIEQSLSIYLEFVHILKKIIQENIFDENCFFLYYQFLYFLNKNNDHITVKYGNYAFKYNYDILETNNLYVNFLPNNKYIYSICSNIYNSNYNIVSGTNKTSTIKYITSTLGLRTYVIQRNINNIKDYILGSIHLGYALILQNVDEIKVEILSVLTNTFRSIQTCLKNKEKNIYIFNRDVIFNNNFVLFFVTKSPRHNSIPTNLKNLCKETIIYNYQIVELVEILLYVNNFPNTKTLSIQICNFVDYINFVYFNQENDTLNEIINIINLCKKSNSGCKKEELLGQNSFIYYYDKLKNVKQNIIQDLIKKILNIDLTITFDMEDKKKQLKQILQQERIHLKDQFLNEYEKILYIMKEKLDDQFLSLVFGRPYSGKSTLLKIYNNLYNSNFSFVYLDSLYDSQQNLNEKFIYDLIKKKQKKYNEYTFIMKINYMTPIIYDFLSTKNLLYSNNMNNQINPEKKIKIIIECNNISFLDPYLLKKINKIYINNDFNIYNYFKNQCSKLIDNILDFNIFFELGSDDKKMSINYKNNYDEKKKILLELYDKLKQFYKDFFLPIFSYIEKKKGNNFNLDYFYYNKDNNIKNINIGDIYFTQTSLFHINMDEKMIINNFMDIFKSQILFYLKEREPYNDFTTGQTDTLSNLISHSSKSNILDNTKVNLEKINTIIKKESSILSPIDESNEEYDLDVLDKSYIENVCISQAERENNIQIEISSKKEISKILTIQNKSIFILISSISILFNNLLIDDEKKLFFSFFKKLIISNGINIDTNLENFIYHIQSNKWLPLNSLFNLQKDSNIDDKNITFYDDEMKKQINSISLLYKGESNICLIGHRKNFKTAILNEIVNSHKKIDHLKIDILKYSNVLSFTMLHEKLIKKNIKKYFHSSVFYICIDDVHINYDKFNNPSIEFLQNLQRKLCYFENKTINIENIKSIISLDFDHIKNNNYYEYISYYHSYFFLNTNKKSLINYFNALTSHSLNNNFKSIHTKMVNYSIDLFWKIHEDINFKTQKENNILFTKESIFLLYQDFFHSKYNFQNEQDIIQTFCENAENMILNRILKKEHKKDIMNIIKNIENKHFPNITRENTYTYINYYSKNVYEKFDTCFLKDEFIKNLSSYNNLYINAKVFVEFYFNKIIEAYKNISKNINSSMIICRNKKRAIILLNAIGFILNINSVIINRSYNLENIQDKINYYNILRFKKNIFILINNSNKYDDYFYSLIYKKFPPVLFDKKELFKMYTKTNLIGSDIMWENIKQMMRNNTYVCIVHERRFDMSISNFQNYKKIYNDINIMHLDCWYKEQYIQYCHLFLKNSNDNHFIDNILNNFKKKVILNTLEDDIDKQTKQVVLDKKEKTNMQELFTNSVDHIKKKQNKENKQIIKNNQKENDTQIDENNLLPNLIEKDPENIEEKTNITETNLIENSQNLGISLYKENGETKADTIIKSQNGEIKSGIFKPKKNVKGQNKQNPIPKAKQKTYKMKDDIKNKIITESITKHKNEDTNLKDKLKISLRSKIQKTVENISNIKKNILLEKGINRKSNAPISIDSKRILSKGNAKEYDNIENLKNSKKEKIKSNATENKNISFITRIKSKLKINTKTDEKKLTKNKIITEPKNAIIKESQTHNKIKNIANNNTKKNKLIKKNKQNDINKENTKRDNDKTNNTEKVSQNETKEYENKTELKKNANSENEKDKIQKMKTKPNQEIKEKEGKIGEGILSEHKINNMDLHNNIKQNNDMHKNDKSENDFEMNTNYYNDLKNINTKIINELNANNIEIHKYNFYNIIEEQLENIVDVFIQVYYDLKAFLKNEKNLDYIRINKYNFIDSLIMFYILIKNKLNYKNKQLYMFKMGLKKLRSIFKNYQEMNIEIQTINSQITQMELDVEKINEDIKNNSKFIIDSEQKFNTNKQILNIITNDIDELIENKNESEKQIEEEYINIIFKIQNVQDNEIKNILKINTPTMTDIYISIMINTLIRNSYLNDNNDNWNYFKAFISKDKFSEFFFNFKKENVTDKQIKRIKEYMAKEEIVYSVTKINNQNNLLTHLFHYLNFILKYKEYYKNVCIINKNLDDKKAKKEQYDAENQKLLEQMHDMKITIVNDKNKINEKNEMIEDLKKKIYIINKSYQPILEIKTFLEKIEKKYCYTIKQIENNYKYLVSEILIFSFFLNYSSSFNYKYRSFLLNKWKQIIKQNNILIKDNIKIETIYSCDTIVPLFLSENFPRHIFYIQNALISMNHFRWPLLLDPQNVGIDWIKKSYRSNLVVHNFDENLNKHLDMCIIYGKTLIISFFNFQNLYIYDKKNDENSNCDLCGSENFKQISSNILYKQNFLKFKLKNKQILINSNYSIIEPVIERNVYLMNGKYYINIGKKKLEYNNQFRLFLVSDTKDRFFEDIEDYANIIDFEIEKNLIVNKIINVILKHEDEKKLINFDTKIRNYYETKQTLKFLDDGMVIEMCTFNRKINSNNNSNNNLINIINNNILKKIEIKKMMKEYKNEVNKIKASSENVKFLGYRFYTIYKILQKHSKIKSIYNFNFNYLLNILNNLIKNINKKMLICNFNQLIKKFTHVSFLFLLNTIDTKDKLYFCFIFYTSLIFEEIKLANPNKSIEIDIKKYYSLFSKIKSIQNQTIESNYLDEIEWLSIRKKQQLLYLQKKLKFFSSIIQDMKNNPIKYFNWYKEKKPEENIFFLKSEKLDKVENSEHSDQTEQLKKLEIIMFIHVMRKDRLYYYIYLLIANYLDIQENFTSNFNFYRDLNYIDTKTFLYINQPNEIHNITLSKYNNIKTISVGNNFNNYIQILIETSMQNGKKLLLENINLINFNIEKLYEIYNTQKIHSNFQLHLTTDKSAPISVINKSIKIYAYHNENFKSLLNKIFSYVHSIYKDKLKNNFINSFLFSLSFFHTILMCRSNYQEYSFDHFYKFDTKDFQTTFDSILYYFDSIQLNNHYEDTQNDTYNNFHTNMKVEPLPEVNQINWDFVKKIILNVYGNKASYIDRKIIKSYILEYFNEYSFNERNEFIYSTDDNYHYKFILNKSIKEYITMIKNYPHFNSCEAYGMKIEADKKKHEKFNNQMIKNIEKINSEEVLICKPQNGNCIDIFKKGETNNAEHFDNNYDENYKNSNTHQNDTFFNLESDYYSSSLINTDIEEDEKGENEKVRKSDTFINEQNNYKNKESMTKDISHNEYISKISNKYDTVSNSEQTIKNKNTLSDNKRMDTKLNFLNNIKKINKFYELIKKLKLIFKHNIAINTEWRTKCITPIQACCINETANFINITNDMFSDLIKIEKQLNKNNTKKQEINIEIKSIMDTLSSNKMPIKWNNFFNQKFKIIDNFIIYFENIKEQLYFWNITGELSFYNIQFLFYPSNFFNALLIKYSIIHKKKLDDCVFITKINNNYEINKKNENVNSQKQLYYSSDEEDTLFSTQINYANYINYNIDNYIPIDIFGLSTLNDNFECLGIKSKNNKKYDEVPILSLHIIEKKEKNILMDKKIPLYQYKYNGKQKKYTNKFITNLYFKSEKHKSFIYINKIYLFIYN
ncbi:dynein heavy chain, putative [Plasmodium vinckei brucechwatti]|uniref:Dynein heavy chain, putative n=1 Tax=Plasmodium vinckei brucechwatti TaxID=119398 RepID=A0A6V7RXW1_PLAVN|nr:dynein heavy chain, putative [Plasmodium vinckei brucechwatti]